MPQTLISEPINRFYYGYLSKLEACLAMTNGNDPDLTRLMLELVRESFQAGARWQLRETARLSPYISRFLEMCILLGPDAPRDIWVETTDATPREYDVPIIDEWLEDVPF